MLCVHTSFDVMNTASHAEGARKQECSSQVILEHPPSIIWQKELWFWRHRVSNHQPRHQQQQQTCCHLLITCFHFRLPRQCDRAGCLQRVFELHVYTAAVRLRHASLHACVTRRANDPNSDNMNTNIRRKGMNVTRLKMRITSYRLHG